MKTLKYERIPLEAQNEADLENELEKSPFDAIDDYLTVPNVLKLFVGLDFVIILFYVIFFNRSPESLPDSSAKSVREHMKNNRKDLIEHPHFSPSLLPSTAAIETTTSTIISSTASLETELRKSKLENKEFEVQPMIPIETLAPTPEILPSLTPSSAPSVTTQKWLNDLARSNGLIKTTDLITTTSLIKSNTTSLIKLNTIGLTKSKHSTKRAPILLPTMKLKPVMYIVAIAGCSMSSALEEFIKSLLQEYGADLLFYGDWEFLTKDKNRYITPDEPKLAVALEKLWETASSQGKSVLIKFDRWIINDNMKDLFRNIIPYKVIVAYRGNYLDRMVCTVRDCFENGFGTAVWADTGKKSNICFERRFSNKTTKAKLVPVELMRGLEVFMPKWKDRLQKSVKRMLGRREPIERVTTEDLWEFQGGSTRVRSLLAWHVLLNAWELPENDFILDKVMDSWIAKHGKRPLLPHKETIYNLEELLKEFSTDKLFQKFVRA